MKTKIRRTLQSQLFSAWRTAVETDYCNERINSERSLQASFWSALNNILPTKNRRLFIEPRVNVEIEGSPKSFLPDLVICNDTQIIAIVELKYMPRVAPRYDKDMETLRCLSAERHQVRFTHRRFLGLMSRRCEFDMSPNTLFVWAGIHRKPDVSFCESSVPLLSNDVPELAGCFAQIHAETTFGELPAVFMRSG